MDKTSIDWLMVKYETVKIVAKSCAQHIFLSNMKTQFRQNRMKQLFASSSQ